MLQLSTSLAYMADQLWVRHEVAISTVILEFMRSPCVLPQVPYRDMRRRQRRGVKLSEQCNPNRERLAAESREEAVTASRKAVGG